MGGYTVGVAGLTVNQLSSDSGGSTPSPPTICARRLMVWHTTFNRENVGSSPAERIQDAIVLKR